MCTALHVTEELTAELVRRVSIACIALSAVGHVAFANHVQGRWVRASPGGKLKCWNAESRCGFLHSMRSEN